MKQRLLAGVGLLLLLSLGAYWVSTLSVFLFRVASWVLIGGAVPGTLLGLIRLSTGSSPGERHTIDSFLQHWGTGTGLGLLLVSGFALRTGPSGFLMTNLHFLGLLYTVVFGCYFLADFLVSRKHAALLPDVEEVFEGTLKKYLLRTSWTERGKYLASQKSAFLAFAVIGGELLLTGAVKLVAMFWTVPFEAVRVCTVLHDAAAVAFGLMLIVHVATVIGVRAHRSLLGSWFTSGKRQPIAKPPQGESEQELAGE